MNNNHLNYIEKTTIILAWPKYPGNIGAAARIAFNMGIGQIDIVGQKHPDQEAVYKTATHNAAHLVDNIRYFTDLPKALAPYSMVVGTTARLGRQRQATVLPQDLQDKLLPHCTNGKIGLLFGPEDRGLSNDELRYCSLVTTIPTAQFSSLNLAQAVAILCYELRQGLLQHPNSKPDLVQQPRTATVQELEPMYASAATLCTGLDQTLGQDMAESRLYQLKKLLGRVSLSAKEAKMIKDTCAQINTALAKTAG